MFNKGMLSLQSPVKFYIKKFRGIFIQSQCFFALCVMLHLKTKVLAVFDKEMFYFSQNYS